MSRSRALGGLDKDYRAMVRRLVRQGWTFLPSPNGGHPRLVSPGGTAVVFPGSPSDWRSYRNTRAKIRQIQREENR